MFSNNSIFSTFLGKTIARLWYSSTQRVMSITAGGMILALVADILIAARLGLTVESDTLIIALTVPRLLEVIVREGTKFSLVSFLVDVEEKQTHEQNLFYVATLFNLALVIGMFVVLICWLFASPIIQLAGPGLDISAKAQAIWLFRASLPLSLFALLSTVLSVFLNSQKHFTVTAVRNMSMPTAVIILMLINWQNSNILSWIAAAHTVGYFVYFIYLLLYALKKTNLQLSITAWPNRTIAAKLGQAIVFPTLGLTVRQSLRIVERALASLISPGSVAAYYFAFRLISSLQTIIGVSLATTKLPSMARMVSMKNEKGFNHSIWRQIKQTAYICLPITAVVFFLHALIIKILFGYGAFDASAISQTSQILQVLSLSIFFLSLTPTLNAALYALQKYKLVWWDQVLNTVIHLILAWWLSKIYGIIGIGMALVIATIVSVLIQIALLNYGKITRILRFKS